MPSAGMLANAFAFMARKTRCKFVPHRAFFTKKTGFFPYLFDFGALYSRNDPKYEMDTR